MRKIILVAVGVAVLICSCETAPAKRKPSEEGAADAIEVTIGGEVKARGQYRDSD